MRVFKNAELIQMPVKEGGKGVIVSRKSSEKLSDEERKKSEIHYNLYVLSNNQDEIKDGDWCYLPYPEKLVLFNSKNGYPKESLKKIISTTDKSIQALVNVGTKLERISINASGVKTKLPGYFIRTYLDELNNGKIIKKVIVEYECPKSLDKNILANYLNLKCISNQEILITIAPFENYDSLPYKRSFILLDKSFNSL
jgi:hypothetical protein